MDVFPLTSNIQKQRASVSLFVITQKYTQDIQTGAFSHVETVVLMSRVDVAL